MKRLLIMVLISVLCLISLAFSAIELIDGEYRYNSTSPQQYKFCQNTAFWAVISIRSLPDDDWDLTLYSDTNFNNSVESSMAGVGYTDFIAVDFNSGCAPLGCYGVMIDRWSGVGGCRIEYENGADAIPAPGTSNSISWEPSHVIKIWNIYLANGEVFTFSLDITGGLIDLGMALFQPSPDCFKDRSEAVWRCDNSAGGGDEQYTYVATKSGQYGFVVWCDNDEAGIYTINIKAPCGKPQLSTPTSGTEDLPPIPTLRWGTVPGANQYHLQIADNPDFLYPENIITTNTEYSPDNLEKCTKWWWRVRASCDNGVTWSDWSDEWWFKICCLPGQVVLISPNNGEADVSLQPRFDWASIPNAIQYEIQVSHDPFPTTEYHIWRTVPTSYYDVPENEKLEEDTLYYWRVRAATSCGWGNWSIVWHFETEVLYNCHFYGKIRSNCPTAYFIGEPVILYKDGVEYKTVNVAAVDLFYRFENLPKGNYSIKFRETSLYNNTVIDTLSSDSSYNINFLCNQGTPGIPTDVEEIDSPTLPESFMLSQNRPNPFNPNTIIEFAIPNRSNVTIDIFDITGRRVKTLVSQTLSAGYKQVTWDGTYEDGGNVPSGIYFYRLRAGEFVETRKMMLLK